MYAEKTKVQLNQRAKRSSDISGRSAVQKKTNPAADVRKYNQSNIFAAMQRKEEKPAAHDSKPNQTGLSDRFKDGIESLSGFSMNDVRVHYNSSMPARMDALAYTQGSHIHVAPGQERHLPHEAWHVVQQKQGRVKPTTRLDSIMINDDPDLEHEADVMGAKALHQPDPAVKNLKSAAFLPIKPVQRKIIYKGKETKAEDFCEDYMANPKDLDKYTEENNKVHRISDRFAPHEAIKAFLNNPNDLRSGESDSYYYIGRKNDIIAAIIEAYVKLKPFSGIKEDQSIIDDQKKFLIRCAIYRVYNGDHLNFKEQHINGQKYSEHLVDQVFQKVGPASFNAGKEYNYDEYTLYNPRTTNIQADMDVGTETSGNNPFHLKYGKYIYRTLPNQTCRDLVYISTFDNATKKYAINTNNREAYKKILLGHAGSILQALKYNGILVRFEMKPGFNNRILKTMSLGGEGSRGAGVGLKSESDEALKESGEKAFSFWLISDCVDYFIDNIQSFEVLELGKVGKPREN